MSYNINNEENRSRYLYNFDRDTDVPVYVPVSEAMSKLHRHDLNIQPKLPEHPVQRKYERKYINTAHSNIKKYERKYIGTAKPPPPKFHEIEHIDNPQNKLHGLPNIKSKAPHSDVYEEFNLKGKTAKDVAISNWRKSNGDLDDLGARIEGHHNKGLGLDDAKSNFMSMYEARLKGQTKPVQEIGKKRKEEKEAKARETIGKLIKGKGSASKVVVVPVVSSEVIPITEGDSTDTLVKDAKATKIQAMVRGSKVRKGFNNLKPVMQEIKSRTAVKKSLDDIVDQVVKKDSALDNKKSKRKSSPPTLTADKKEPEITPPTTKGRPRSNSSPKLKSVIDADAQGTPNYVKKAVEAKEEDIAKNEGKDEEVKGPLFNALNTYHKKKVRGIVDNKKGSENITYDNIVYLQKHHPKAFPKDKVSFKVSYVKKHFGLS